jgi:ATP-binding cassette subfamily B multidrug efflux pump
VPYIAMICSSLGVALADMCIPVFIGQLVALMAASDRAASLAEHGTSLSVMVMLVLIVRPLLQFADIAIRHNALMPGATTLVRWQSHWHVLRHSWPFFQKDFAGRLANRVMQTAHALRDSVMASIRAVLYLCTYGGLTLVLVSRFDWWLTMPPLLWLAGYLVFLRYFVPRLRELSRQSSEVRSLVMARVVDSYTNILTVKLFSKLSDEDAYVREVVDEHQAAISRHMRMTSRFMFTLQSLNAMLLVSMATIGLTLWSRGQLSAAQVATALPLVWQITNMAGWVSFEIAGIFENIGVVQEGMQTISVPHTLVDEPDAKALTVTRGEIRFDHVSFNYGLDHSTFGKPVLDHIDLVVRPGERIGLVGRSGAGKSTLVNLLLRFYQIEHGRITVDGQDIRRVAQESLRAQIGLVTQDTSLLHRSIADNIRYGRPHATQAEIEAAARKAEAHEFILGPRRRARRETLRRPASAHRARARDPEERAHPAAGRSNLRTRQRDRGQHPGTAHRADGRQDRDRHRASPVHDRAARPAGRARPRQDRRAGHAQRTAAPQWNLCSVVATPIRRFSGRGVA